MSLHSGSRRSRTRSNEKRRASEYSDRYSYGSSQHSSRSASEASYDSERESKKATPNNKASKKNSQASQQRKRAPLLIRGQRDLAKRRGTGEENVTNKMLQENKIKMGELRNRNLELADVITKYEAENRDLVRIIRKQEKHLKHFQEQENSMPTLIQRQSAESHSLQEQIRILKEKLKKQESRMKAAEDELEQKQRLLKKMKGLVDDHQLKEREELSQKLTDVENELKSKSEVIRNLEKHIENLNKNHKHELGIKKAKQQTTSSELDVVKKDLERIQAQLQEKEKELAVLNIYAQQRLQSKPPHRLTSSIRSTPLFDKPSAPANSRNNKTQNNFLDDSVLTDKSFKIEKSPSKKPPASLPTTTTTNNNVNENNSSKTKTQKQNNNDSYAQDSKSSKVKEQEDIDRKIREMEKNAKMKAMKTSVSDAHDSNVAVSNSSPKKDVMKPSKDKNNQDLKLKQQQKEILLEKLKEIDENGKSTKKSGKATTIDDDYDDLHFGSYRPTFGEEASNNGRHQNKSKKKAELLSELFADDPVSPKYSSGNQRIKSPVFLNLDSDSAKKSNHYNHHQQQGANKSHLLPLRAKQQTNTLNGIDSDDD